MDAAKAGLAATLLLVLSACNPHADGQTVTSTTTSRDDRFGEFTYPGATPDEPATFTARTQDGSHTIAGFTTSDPFARVYAYYRRTLPSGSETMHVISLNGAVATFEIDPRSQATVDVQISSDKPNFTEILITRFQRRWSPRGSWQK